ncbi:Non-repetitive/WGA-negative nucleoporin C-terminal-domain-containing protein [Multifurca ochricompacta]|uniref:Non-repetitive/WGA-negative nucleoporin C-terminal-domain-containing protein n=1 Tax=Multifurca ochricompacta TaxID=376703 RepID=A0AAD4MBA2_9AGAM|nr:Non-repetitive/WGA-negative nucleoporin C-terminal-domain-containing protein [Multifurca ochricompacta]
MAAFTGSPPSRRKNRPQSRQTAISPPPRRVGRFASSRPASRLPTPARGAEQSTFIREDVTVGSMDIDEDTLQPTERGLRQDTVFAKSQEMLVTFHGHLPAEVKHVLRNADFFRDAYVGDVDSGTGFALVATPQACFVWQHTQELVGIPTCYIFPCPPDLSQAAPLHAFVPYGSLREPGLILASQSGEIWFWVNIGVGLAGGEQYSRIPLELESTENLNSLTRLDPQTFVASTSLGRLFRLTLTTSGGRYQFMTRPFTRPQSSLSLSRFLPSLWSSSALQAEAGNITATAIGTKTNLGTDIWTLVESRVQKWNISAEGWEELALQEDIATVVRPAIQNTLRSPSKYLDLELLDVAVDSSGMLLVLTSHGNAGEPEEMNYGSTPRRLYVVAQISMSSDMLQVDKLISVPYQSTFRASEAPLHPQLRLMLGGAILVVQFGDAIAFCSRDNDFKDRIELKSTTDRTLGVCVADAQSCLLVLTASTLMKVTIDFDQVQNFDPAHGRSVLIKSIMTQAILYGSYPENPLHFSFPPEIEEESLMSGAALLSSAILESDTTIIRPNNDLTVQLNSRKEKISFLIKFINENGVLGKMSQRSRQRLATDAEKLYAAQQLWLRLNETILQRRPYDILSEAVYGYMNQVGEGQHDDLMRAFFRLRAVDIGKLLPHVRDGTRRLLGEAPTNVPNILSEANSIVLTILTSAFEYRDYNAGVYGVESLFVKPWTSKPEVINVVLELFDLTTTYVQNFGESPDEHKARESNSQLPDLASALFASVHERIGWLQSAVATEVPGVDREISALADQFQQLRPEILNTLNKYGFSARAFELAEKYHDFRSLAALCNKDLVYPLDQNPHGPRMVEYIERFRDEFTTELYQWYIEHGELRTLFSQGEVHPDYLDEFFLKNDRPFVSWIQDLEKERFHSAAETLLAESEHASDLAAKELMLSIGKLTHLAQMQEDTTLDESLLDSFHDGLDFVSVHEALTEELKSALASVRSKQSFDRQVETILQQKASAIIDKRVLPLIFKQLVRSLLQGKALSVEDIVDILSMKDNDTTISDYATALHLLARADNLPEARRQAAFRSVWRRIYTHDNWDTIKKTSGVSDTQLNDRFRSTALVTALSATLSKRHQPEGYTLSPSQALAVPSSTELSSRWPGMSPEQIEGLVEDYQEESALLTEYDLSEAFGRAREVVLDEMMWGRTS